MVKKALKIGVFKPEKGSKTDVNKSLRKKWAVFDFFKVFSIFSQKNSKIFKDELKKQVKNVLFEKTEF